jgi:hypothetical protein
MADTPAKYAEIEDKLGQPLGEFITAGRTAGLSWRRLATEVSEQTGIEVSHEALRIWTLGRPAVGAA